MKYATLALCACLAACATPPAYHDVQNSQRVNRPYDEVWSGIVEKLASRNIPLKNIAKDSGVIYAEKSQFADVQADCGQRGLFIPVGRMASVNVFVKKISDTSVQVTVNSDFKERRRFGENYSTVECNSTGQVEQWIFAAARGDQ